MQHRHTPYILCITTIAVVGVTSLSRMVVLAERLMIKLKHLFMAALAAISLTPLVTGGPAFAAPTFDTVAGWNIKIDDDGRSCSAEKLFDQHSEMVIFYIRDQRRLTFLLGNDSWTTIRDGTKYYFRVVFDGQDPWEGTFFGMHVDSHPTIWAVLDIQFLEAFIKHDRADLYASNGNRVTGVSLAGGGAALGSLFNCLQSVGVPTNADLPNAKSRK
jgi:hypothetical protein